MTAPGAVLDQGPARLGDAAKKDLGRLPEWNLADLYSGPEAPELKADLATSDRAATAMQESYQGKLATLADGGKGGKALVQAVREFEALNDLLGRIISYASLLYAADTSDPERQKFYGDMQEKITTISSKLLFFPLELNRLEDDVLEKAMSAIRSSGTTGLGLRICARKSPTSSTTSSSSSSTRRRSRAAAPGTGCSTRP